MSKIAKSRAIFACFGLAGCFSVFSARLVFLQVLKHDEYAAEAARNHVLRQTIPATRGSIVDCHGEVLAISEPLKTVIADGTHIADPARLADALADLLEMPPAELRGKLTTKRQYVVLKKQVTEQVAMQIRERLRTEKLRGIYFEQDSRRVYPNGPMLGHVLGFMNHEHDGVQGIERTMNRYLRGSDGFRFIERDRLGREIVPFRREEHPARAGYNARLTIDMALQNIVEEELRAAFEKYTPEMATAIMMEPQSGRILALANYPNYDPNKPGEGEAATRRNCAIINLVEPGSTFKIVTAAAALNDHAVTLSTIIPCEHGRFHFAGRVLRDHGAGPFPDLSVADILVKSSNIGAAKLAMKLGENRFYEYIRRFGFGERTGIALPGEIAGIVHSPYSSGWSKISISRIPMGQGVAVTPLQMVAAMSAIANGGRLMMPQIVDEIFDEENNAVVAFPPSVVRQVVSPEATQCVKLALKDVVGERGTAKGGAVPGYSAAGKTGTAQKPDEKGGYYNNRYVTSFIGFLPVDQPRFVLLVLLDDAKVPSYQNYGGTLAAPVFSRIAERTAHQLGIPPDLSPDPTAAAGIKLTRSGD